MFCNGLLLCHLSFFIERDRGGAGMTGANPRSGPCCRIVCLHQCDQVFYFVLYHEDHARLSPIFMCHGRFGKFTQLQFDDDFRMVGSGCTTYLLEESRVVEHEAG